MSTTERAQSDLKKLKSKYNSQLSTLKELFTEWTDDDLLFTLQDADGDLELAIDRISEGHANQWGEVKTKKSKKEAAAANKAILETPVSSAVSSTTTYPSYSSTTSRQSKPLKPRSSAAATSTAAATFSSSSRSAHHPKPHAVAWQSSKKADFDGWNTPQQKTDDGNSWNTVENSTPKKISSTPSSSTKTSNVHRGGGAKTWASLLQSKAEPEPVKKPATNDLYDASEKELPPLQKVDDAWLSGPTPANDSLNQWDQPIQESIKSSLSPSSPPPATTSISSTTAATTTTTQPQIKKALDDGISIDFNSLSLKEKENVPEVSNHPSVADLLNSVKQQDQTPTSQPAQQQAAEHQPQQHQHQQQQPYQQQQQPTEQQLYHQMYQQQQQHQQYQQFGMHGYGNAFNAGYGIYGNSTNSNAAADSLFQPSSGLFNNHQQHHENDSNVNNSTKTTGASTTSTTASNGGIPAVNDMYSQQPQYNNMQSFYPYYYMQNQFNAYPSYGQPSLNHRYDQPGVGNLANSMASPYGGASSAYSSQLYGGFDDFGLGSATHQNTTTTSPDANKKTAPSTTASATSSIQQPYANYFNGQSPMFSSYGQQNRNSGNQQYWNQ
ncbi:SCF ubiquitin ligase complex subunit cdc4 [Mucor velutinosus]|uniref:RNA polymerase II degradation factor 1 n=1 Tax=Mucor velutinosus TaxID=708070 RepID=A0AAN7D9Q3_9FUNG|nr:SCF ubiquitin ligase complex subunit cdc4 [Mucor velutinosus]